MTVSPSATTAGKGSSSPGPGSSSRPGGPGVRQRKPTAGGRAKSGSSMPGGGSGPVSAGMWRFYTEDSPGLKVGPVPVLVMSLIFIASVFVLHIWGKYTRA